MTINPAPYFSMRIPPELFSKNLSRGVTSEASLLGYWQSVPVRRGYSAMLAQYPVCPKADAVVGNGTGWPPMTLRRCLESQREPRQGETGGVGGSFGLLRP